MGKVTPDMCALTSGKTKATATPPRVVTSHPNDCQIFLCHFERPRVISWPLKRPGLWMPTLPRVAANLGVDRLERAIERLGNVCNWNLSFTQSRKLRTLFGGESAVEVSPRCSCECG